MENFFIIHGIFRFPSPYETKVFLIVLVYSLVFIYSRAWYQIGKTEMIQRLSLGEKECQKDKSKIDNE